jgi:hypothetical protein
MFKSTNNNKVLALTLLTSVLLLAILSPNIISVKAQGQDTVNVLDSVGGTTDPTPRTYSYADGTAVTFTATPINNGFVIPILDCFYRCIILTITDNPAVITVSGGITYNMRAVFKPVQAPVSRYVPQPDDAIVIVLAAAGGTTNPLPGIYHLANATQFNLKAIPNSGYQFSHWVISGPNLSHGGYPYTTTKDNPYNVNHSYENRCDHQAVFSPTGTGTTPTPTGGARLHTREPSAD